MRIALRDALLTARRSPLLSVLGVITIAFSLFAFGVFGLVALNLETALEQVEERVEIRAFVTEGTDAASVAAAVARIASYPEVAAATLVTETQALEKARRELTEFADIFEGAFLPASIEVRLRPGARSPETVAAVARRLRSLTFVDDVRYGAEWLDKLYRIRTIARLAGLALGSLFAVVAAIIISATIRTAVLAREREIAIMRLVGATDGFIRLPFLIEGATKGLLGGVVALALTWGANGLIDRYLIRTVFFDVRTMLLGLLFGVAIGLAGSAVSVGRHLRRV